LTSWLGELLTEGHDYFPVDGEALITLRTFEKIYAAALRILPNNNILNLLSKTKQEPYKTLVPELFRTDHKTEFKYDVPALNYLYLNGIIVPEVENETLFYAKFSCPFVQKRLFNYFSYELFDYLGPLIEPFEDLADTLNDKDLHIKALIQRYEAYLQKTETGCSRMPRSGKISEWRRRFITLIFICFYSGF